MKRILRRSAAALAAVLLLGTSAAGAHAEELPLAFDGARCESFPATREGFVDAWHLQRLRMDDVWRLATGDNVKIAVLDTGVSILGSPYLPASRFRAFDFVGYTDDEEAKRAKADCLHGTEVVSLIAAGLRDDGPIHQQTNFAGIAPDAEIISYRVLTHGPSADGEPVPPQSLQPAVDAVHHAIEAGVDIINLSFTTDGGAAAFDQFEAAINRAVEAGIVVVAAAGNGKGNQGALFPASFPGVISVGMSNQGDAADPESYRWSRVTIGAPGYQVLALAPSTPDRAAATSANQAFRIGSGTSFAAPIVSGVVALMIEFNREWGDEELTSAMIAERLIETADPPPSSPPDRQLGYGIVNPLRAVLNTQRAAAPTETAAAAPPSTPTAEPEQVDTRIPALGLGVAVGAVLLAGLGVVAAIAIPAALRRPEAD